MASTQTRDPATDDEAERRRSALLIERLQQLIEERRTSAAAVSREAGLGDTAVYDILRGRVAEPTLRVLRALSNVLDCDLNYLLGGPGGTEQISPVDNIPVRGIVETGAYRRVDQMNEAASDWPRISGVKHPRFPGADHFALHIQDEAMDTSRPQALSKGSYALCVNMTSANLIVESGKLYAIQRTIGTNGDRMIETIVRRASVFSDRVELTAENRNGKDHKLVIPGQLSTSPDDAICAIGLMYAVVAFLD